MSVPLVQDPFGRPPITPDIKQAIRDAFAIVPPGKTSAVVAIFDQHGPRLHAAWKGETESGFEWQVGGVVGFPPDQRPYGEVYVALAWGKED